MASDLATGLMMRVALPLEVRERRTKMPRPKATREYLLASDFDQTLSFNDSGIVLGELLGAHGFEEKVKGLARINLVQQGGELSYLLLHDPEYRKVRREQDRKST